jgi:hypothetical protein
MILAIPPKKTVSRVILDSHLPRCSQQRGALYPRNRGAVTSALDNAKNTTLHSRGFLFTPSSRSLFSPRLTVRTVGEIIGRGLI